MGGYNFIAYFCNINNNNKTINYADNISVIRT